MSISNSKTRYSLVIEKNNKKILEDIAKKNDRSLNYMINLAIKEFIENQGEKK